MFFHRRLLLRTQNWWRCSLAGNSKISILGEESRETSVGEGLLIPNRPSP